MGLQGEGGTRGGHSKPAALCSLSEAAAVFRRALKLFSSWPDDLSGGVLLLCLFSSCRLLTTARMDCAITFYLFVLFSLCRGGGLESKVDWRVSTGHVCMNGWTDG